MKTAFESNDQTQQVSDDGFAASAAALDLAQFNREHGAEIRRNAAASARYRANRRVNRMFEAAGLLLLVSTVIASAVSVLTMVVH